MTLSGRSRAMAVGAGFALALACSSDDGTDPGPDTTPAALDRVSGNGQTGTTGTVLSSPFVIAVRNAGGDPLANVTVEWTVQGGGGSLTDASSTTNAQGQAQTTYTLGTTAGTQTVRATVPGTALEATFTVMATAPVDPTPASIQITGGDDQSGLVGDPLVDPFSVVVRNAAAQALSGVTVTWTVTQGGGTANPATSTTSAQGVASTTYTLGPSAGTNTVDAAVQSDPSLAQTFTATANAPPSAVDVSVQDNFFDPDEVTVAASGTVTWTWNGAVEHNVTWVSGGFSNSATQAAGMHQVMFPATPDTFTYYCTIHGTPTTVMRGSVIVK